MNKVLFGRYLPGDSLIHKMDPRSKLLFSLVYLIILFTSKSWIEIIISISLPLVVVILSQISFRFFWQGIKPLLTIILLTIILQIFFSKGGHVYWQYNIFAITQSGIINAMYIFFRFILMLLMSTTFTLTTAPMQLSIAMESLLKPLKKLGLPIYEISLMLSIALRFVPTLIDESQKIINAQKVRGLDFKSGNIFQKVKKAIAILIPLFESSFTRAEELSNVLEARGYYGGVNRSSYRQFKYSKIDQRAALIMVILIIVIILNKIGIL